MLLRVSNAHARILPRWNTQKTALLTALLTAFRAYCYVGTQKTALLTALLPALHLPQVMWSSCWAPYALELTQFTVYAVYWLLLVQIHERGGRHTEHVELLLGTCAYVLEFHALSSQLTYADGC